MWSTFPARPRVISFSYIDLRLNPHRRVQYKFLYRQCPCATCPPYHLKLSRRSTAYTALLISRQASRVAFSEWRTIRPLAQETKHYGVREG